MKKLGWWFLGFGLFLILCGVAGYLSNPEKAKTALISGSVFGTLNIIWGLCMLRRLGFARWAGIGTCVLLLGAFSWRSVVTWQAVAAGEPKVFAAILITAMLVASVATLIASFLLIKSPASDSAGLTHPT